MACSFFFFFFFGIASATCCILDKSDAVQLYILHLCYMKTSTYACKTLSFHAAKLSLCATKAREALWGICKRPLLATENSCKYYQQVLQFAVVTDHEVFSYARVIHICQNGNRMSFLVTFSLITQLSAGENLMTLNCDLSLISGTPFNWFLWDFKNISCSWSKDECYRILWTLSRCVLQRLQTWIIP